MTDDQVRPGNCYKLQGGRSIFRPEQLIAGKWIGQMWQGTAKKWVDCRERVDAADIDREIPDPEEIIEKYQHLIPSKDFEILTIVGLPAPETLRREGAWIELFGFFRGSWLLLKKYGWRVVVLIATIDDFRNGLEYVDTSCRVAYDNVQQMLRLAFQNSETPATKYVVAHRDLDAWGGPDYSFDYSSSGNVVVASTSSTTTTTTPPPEAPSPDSLPVGSGLIPWSDGWM